MIQQPTPEFDRHRPLRPLRWTVVGLIAVAALGYLYVVEPGRGTTPGCPSFLLTGWLCPGCGSLRAIHALLHGELARAWALNPLLVAMGPALMAGVGIHHLRSWQMFKLRHPEAIRWLHLALAATLIAWGITRNLSC